MGERCLLLTKYLRLWGLEISKVLYLYMLGWVLKVMEMMLLSFVGPAVQSEWGLSSRLESFITNIVFAGMLVGAYLGGVVSNNHARRKGFLIPALIVMFVASFLRAFSPNYASLLILHCLVGVGLGGCPALRFHRGF
ncbi:hypothetical protein GIB67_027675 [Kingdonia uniflora]|uniref:Major facilitator superfamily (MFS) profile domain-containing protein n=1 Tax=Kingdonia uniflora TaxID=39325 RepID=A0A7J7NL18_9MAGN|nr:hypothetical protein GIB67_027675 [Kingdonia uniflora]